MPQVSDRPTIGKFSRPKDSPKVEAKKEEVPKEPDTKLEEEVKKTEEELQPLEAYEKALEKAKITKEEAAIIVDDVLMKGYYSEMFKLTSKVSGKFRTRSYTDTLRINSALELIKPQYNDSFSEIVYRYTLAASLEKFADRVFKFATDKSSADEHEKLFQERLSYIESLPDLTVRLLYDKLTKFDEKLRTVLKEGAIEIF